MCISRISDTGKCGCNSKLESVDKVESQPNVETSDESCKTRTEEILLLSMRVSTRKSHRYYALVVLRAEQTHRWKRAHFEMTAERACGFSPVSLVLK